MAKPNYSYEKRQKELAKQKKKADKLLKKSGSKEEEPAAAEQLPSNLPPSSDEAPVIS